MKNSILKIFAIIMVVGFSTSAMAQATATATATATIVTTIGIANTADMNFGNVAVTGTAGTVILATDGARTTSGGVTLPNVTGTVAAASFNVTGEGIYTYAITLPTVDHVISSGSESMQVNTFTSDPSGTGTLSAGAQTILVGATLNVAASQLSGVYTNATGFDVTVNYN